MPKFLISDCDYTLVDFHHKGGIDALRNHPDHHSLADPVNEYFEHILQGMRIPADKTFIQLKKDLENLAEKIITSNTKLDDAVWSRELWIYRHLNKISRPDRIKQSQEAANIYWEGVGQKSDIYKDVPLFIERLRQNKFTVILVSSSDARLIASKDKTGFIYDPAESKKLKIKRYELSNLKNLFDLQQELFIGDPHSKPHQIFWEEVLRETSIDTDNSDHHIVVIGDSYNSDLKGAAWFKTQSILIDRDRKHQGVSDLPAADHVAGSLTEALRFIL